MAIVSRSGEVPVSVSQAREDSGDVLLVTCTRAGDEKIDLARELLGRGRGTIVGGTKVLTRQWHWTPWLFGACDASCAKAVLTSCVT